MRGICFAVLALVGCANTIPVEDSCAEQAQVWCERAEGNDNCTSWLTGVCAAHRVGEEVEVEDHFECLDAIESNENTQRVPDVCQEQWGYGNS